MKEGTENMMKKRSYWAGVAALALSLLGDAHEAQDIAQVSREQVIAAAGAVTLDTVFFLASKPGEPEKEEESHE